MGTRVLLISDDAEIGRIWAYSLSQKGLVVDLVLTSQDALQRWEEEAFDLFVIDVHTPQLDGIDLCRQLRSAVVNPILLFTHCSEEAHILQAYQVGADECVVKSVSPSLFLAKVGAWLRRSWTVRAGALDSLQVGEFQLDPNRRTLAAATGSATKLTNLEFRLLYLLMSHQGQVLRSDLIVDRVWGYAAGGTIDDAGAPTLRWSGVLTLSPVITVTYAATVTHVVSGTATFILPKVITNTAVIAVPGYAPIIRTVTVWTNWHEVYLPLVMRQASTQ